MSLPVKTSNDDDCCKMMLKVNIGRNAMFFAQTINHDKEIFVRVRGTILTSSNLSDIKYNFIFCQFIANLIP